jgi:hypothetical protein
MIFEKINFNEKHWKDKSFEEFSKHEAHHGLSEKKMKEAYDLMCEKVEKKKKK